MLPGTIKYFSIFLLMVSLAWGSYGLIGAGTYPVALVNNKVVWGKEFKTTHQSALNFYGKLKNPDVDQPTFEKEIRRATLDKLIESRLIFEEVGRAEIDNQLANLVSQNPNLEKGAVLTYGIPWVDFKNLVLRPQIALEILQKDLQDKNKNFDEWLKNKRISASVWIFVGGLDWQDSQVVAE